MRMQLTGCVAPAARSAGVGFARRRAGRIGVVARSGARRSPSSDGPTTLYDVLEVRTDASDIDIKASYRKLQKEFHPDQSGDEYSGLSTQINAAFTTLKDPKLRQAYDKELRSANGGRMPGAGDLRRRTNGLVGPVRGGNLLLQSIIALSEDDMTSGVEEVNRRLVIWIREWCRTLVFAAANPLPLSLQADDVPGGNRMSMVTVRDGSVETVGALEITVIGAASSAPAQAEADVEELASRVLEESFNVQVRRITFGESLGALPGEDRILNSLRSALRMRKKKLQRKHRGLGLTGIAALVTSGLMGGASIFGMQNEEVGDLEAYHLKHPPLNKTGVSSLSGDNTV